MCVAPRVGRGCRSDQSTGPRTTSIHGLITPEHPPTQSKRYSAVHATRHLPKPSHHRNSHLDPSPGRLETLPSAPRFTPLLEPHCPQCRSVCWPHLLAARLPSVSAECSSRPVRCFGASRPVLFFLVARRQLDGLIGCQASSRGRSQHARSETKHTHEMMGRRRPAAPHPSVRV